MNRILWLRELADGADDLINYAFSEPTVAISSADVLKVADELQELQQLVGEALAGVASSHEPHWPWDGYPDWEARARGAIEDKPA